MRECSTISFNLDLPMEVRFQNTPAEALAMGRELLRAVLAEFPSSIRQFAPAIRGRLSEELAAELDALAPLAEVTWEDLLLANVSYDLALAYLGCSTAALATPDGPVIARNMDWWPEDKLAAASHLLEYTRGGQTAFINAAWPGGMGAVTGLSSRGFAVVLNAVLSDEGLDTRGFPVMLHVRRVLEHAESFDDALERLTHQRLASAALFTLAGKENHQRVVIERTPTRHSLRWAEDDRPLIATNHYRQLDRPRLSSVNELYLTTCTRYDALVEMLDAGPYPRSVRDDELLACLTDARVIQGITAQHVILQPASNRARLLAPSRFAVA